jgi:hypothetical protein
MFTSTSGRSSSASTNPTRQQLDELDALLQQMLDLPVNSDGTASAEEMPVEPSERGPTQSPVESASSTLTAAPIVHGPEPVLGQGPMTAFPFTVTEVVSAPLSMRASPPPSISEAVKPSVRPVEDVASANEQQRKLDAAFAAAAPPVAPSDPMKSSAEIATEEGEEWVPFRSSWQPSPQTWQPLVESWQQGRGSRANPEGPAQQSAVEIAPAGPAPVREKGVSSTPYTGGRSTLVPPSAKPIAPPTAPKPNSTPLRPPQAPPHVEEPAGVLWIFWPLLLVNVLFDLLLWPLGPLGTALRSRPGRSFLGMVGLGCLAAAGAWALLDYLGLDLLARLR